MKLSEVIGLQRKLGKAVDVGGERVVLKPCPNCNSTNVNIDKYTEFPSVFCVDCWSEVKSTNQTCKTAIELWNGIQR